MRVLMSHVMFACLLSLFPAHALSFQANPQDGWYYYKFKLLGVNFEGFRKVDNSLWVASNNPWNGRNTSAGNRIQNADTPNTGFPFNVVIPGVGVVAVTQAMSDAAWDDFYAGCTRISNSTFAKNCFGYCTGKSYWVDEPGFDQIMTDEYDIVTMLAVSDILKEVAHCMIITKICDNGGGGAEPSGPTGFPDTISETKEKNGSSGVYKCVYYCPGGKDPGGGTLYRKK